jgi:nitrite reductase (NADH) large subunit
MVKDLMLHTMAVNGKYVRNIICEHFHYSRQELFDLVKINQLKSYDEVLDVLEKMMAAKYVNPLYPPSWQVFGTN